jgi:(p)ppGpp synthase/HD superfamily hydrolase
LTCLSDVIQFAKLAHSEQKRKYTGAPYFSHCANVAKIVSSVTDDIETICAAYLHDVVEDISRDKMLESAQRLDLEANYLVDDDRWGRLMLINYWFGPKVCNLVEEVTDVSRPEDGNRKTRKKLDLEHLAGASPEGQTIKLADLMDNARDIQVNGPNFAVVYMREKKDLLKVLTKGNKDLYNVAQKIIDEYYGWKEQIF